MLSDLSLLQIYGAMARHAAESQRVSATNISRAGEPGYKAVEVESFQDYLERAARTGSAAELNKPFRLIESDGPAAPNGNTVTLEQEVFKSAEAVGQHNMALSVYTKSLDMMRTALGKQR